MISAPDMPSITAWWILVSSALLPEPRPSIRYSSQSGRLRSSGRLKMRATCAASCASDPGVGSAISRTW